MTRPSPELVAITTRWFEALATGNGTIMANLLSSKDPLLFCGTALEEVYRGDFFRGHYADHIAEIPRARHNNIEIDAFEHGETGWVFWSCDMEFLSTGREAHARVTLVFAMEDGIWKIQHIHNSFPVPNGTSMGVEHTVFDDLLRAAASADPMVGKTGIAAVMFTDIVDSSVLATIVGDAAWTKRVQQHMELLHRQVTQNEGRLIKSLGDGTMSTFPSARAAMTAAQTMQRTLAEDTSEPQLTVRIGIHTGDVVQAGDDFFGTVVNKAARVAAVAGGGEIRVSDATRIMVGTTPDFKFEDPVHVPLKGLDGEHAIYRLAW